MALPCVVDRQAPPGHSPFAVHTVTDVAETGGFDAAVGVAVQLGPAW